MSRVNFIFILSFIFFNFSFNNVFASSEFSNDFIEQAKKLGITIDKKSTQNKTSNNKNIKILDNKNFPSTNVQSLPEVPKPQDSKQVKLSEVPKPQDSKQAKLPEVPKPQDSKQVKLPEVPNPQDSKQVKLPEVLKPQDSKQAKLPEVPKPQDSKQVKLPEVPKSQDSKQVKLPEVPKSQDSKQVKLPEVPKPQDSKQVKLPEVSKPQDSKQVKLPEVSKSKINKKEKLQQNKNTIKSNKKLNQKTHLKNSKSNIIKNDQVNLVKKKVVPKKNNKSISYFPAPEEFIDNNDFNEKNYMRRKPYNYDIKPPKYLLDLQKKGIKTNIPKFMFKDELSKLLFVAVNDQNIGAIKGLLLKGANINAQNKSNEYTPLMYAVENSKTNSLRYLLIRGANPNFVTSNKMSALHLAAIMNNLKAVRVLLGSDFNMFLQDKYNKTFFDYVQDEYKNIVISDIFDTRKDADKALIDFCTLRSLEGMKFAIQNNANVNAQNNNGDTPLILAVRYNNPKLVIYLLSIGADQSIKNKYKGDARAVAIQNKYGKILNILETIKFNKDLYTLGLSKNMLHYKFTDSEQKQINRNNEEIKIKNFNEYPSQGVLGVISNKSK